MARDLVWCEAPDHPTGVHEERGNGPYGDDWRPGNGSCRYPHSATTPPGREPVVGHPYTIHD